MFPVTWFATELDLISLRNSELIFMVANWVAKVSGRACGHGCSLVQQTMSHLPSSSLSIEEAAPFHFDRLLLRMLIIGTTAVAAFCSLSRFDVLQLYSTAPQGAFS